MKLWKGSVVSDGGWCHSTVARMPDPKCLDRPREKDLPPARSTVSRNLVRVNVAALEAVEGGVLMTDSRYFRCGLVIREWSIDKPGIAKAISASEIAMTRKRVSRWPIISCIIP